MTRRSSSLVATRSLRARLRRLLGIKAGGVNETECRGPVTGWSHRETAGEKKARSDPRNLGGCLRIAQESLVGEAALAQYSMEVRSIAVAGRSSRSAGPGISTCTGCCRLRCRFGLLTLDHHHRARKIFPRDTPVTVHGPRVSYGTAGAVVVVVELPEQIQQAGDTTRERRRREEIISLHARSIVLDSTGIPKILFQSLER